jgi:GntR family transcriptional regulator/MocR family aminotransferase
VPPFEQAVLAEFIVEGHFGRHLRRMREVYAERLAVLMESASAKLVGLLEISSVEAGLQTIGWLPQGIDDGPQPRPLPLAAWKSSHSARTAERA